eukprot:4733043-Prymnesium_polylepis.1
MLGWAAQRRFCVFRPPKCQFYSNISPFRLAYLTPHGHDNHALTVPVPDPVPYTVSSGATQNRGKRPLCIFMRFGRVPPAQASAANPQVLVHVACRCNLLRALQ